MERFSVECKPTDKEFIVSDGDIRISVLSARIIRVERGVFTDKPTQLALCRNFAKPKFKAKKEADKIVIETKSVKFIINKKSLRVECEIDGKLVKPDERRNLGGTARTLDGTAGVIFKDFSLHPKKGHFCVGIMNAGIFSKDGVTVVDDGKSCILEKDGSVSARKEGSFDRYVFAFGSDYLSGLREYYSLTGFAPTLPKYALGNWWSRYYAYSDKAYLALMEKFELKNVPLTVATIDMDWHIVKNVPKDCRSSSLQGAGWTGYTFEKSLFPDYKKFLKSLKDKNLAVTMNLHPRDGVRYFEQQYGEMARANGIDPASRQPVKFDLTNKTFRDSYFDILHHPYERDGVDFWWIDWQQGQKSAIKGLDPLWLLNHYHTLDANRNGRKGLILSRYAGLGSHRYPLGFSGDTLVCWSSLKLQPYFTATAANAGYSWWSHDIGGHLFGKGNGELYLRWVQFGVFSPVMRLHSSNNAISKEPWLYGAPFEEHAEEFLRLRHRLLPYLYTANVRTAKEGIPLVAPMYYYSKAAEAYERKNQYFFGSEAFVSPVVKKADANGKSRSEIWFPEGGWTDFFSEKRYVGGKSYTVENGFDSIPVFVKDGGIIPMLAEREGNSTTFDELEVRVYLGADNSYVMYDEDRGGIEFKLTCNNDSAVFDVKPSLDSALRAIKVVFYNLRGADIALNGKSRGHGREIRLDKRGGRVALSGVVER